MIDIEINNNTYKLPDSWDDITLQRFDDIIQFEQNWTGDSDLIKSVELMTLLLGCNKIDIMGLKQNDFIDLANRVKWSNSQPQPKKNVNTITIDNITYMTPNNMNELSIGEAISMEGIMKANPNDLAGIVAIILRPRVKVFNKATKKDEWEQEAFCTKSYPNRKQLFLDNLIITEALSITNFFLPGVNGSSKNMKGTSEKE